MRILFIEEDAQDYLIVRQKLDINISVQNIHIDWAPNYESAFKLVKQNQYDTYMIGYYENQKKQIDFLAWLYETTLVPVILLLKSEHQIRDLFINKYRADYLQKSQLSWTLLEYAIHHIHHLMMLENTEKKFRAIFDNAFEFIALLDTQGCFLEVNRHALAFINAKLEDLLNQPIWKALSERLTIYTQTQFKADILSAAKGRFIRHEIKVNNLQHNTISLDFSLTPIRDNNGKIAWLLAEGRDLSERQRLEQKLTHATLYDQLTGLPNRNSFIEQLEQAMQRVQEKEDYNVAILYIDLDRFKIINTSLGHDMGDWLLMEIADRLRDYIKKTDLLARSGGDEFLILLDHLDDLSEATQLATTINQILSQPFNIDGYRVVTSASIGVAYSQHQKDSLDLLRAADIAMHHVKSTTKSDYSVYSQQMTTFTSSRLEIEADLHQGLQKEDFIVFYQPQIELKTERPVSMEALVRFNHPRQGLMPPAEFISILEEMGSILDLEDWVLRTACTQFKQWLKAGLSFERIILNMSPYQLSCKRIINKIETTLALIGLEPSQLELEMTERVLLTDVTMATKVLSALHDMGIHITIDDFGTAYTALHDLKRFPIDSIKIDENFIEGIMDSPTDAAITVATIDMAHALGLTVIAEGVETIEQRDFLRDHNCDFVQGYLYAPAMDNVKFMHWAKQYSKMVF